MLLKILLLIHIDFKYLHLYVYNFNFKKISRSNGNTAQPKNGIENKIKCTVKIAC